MRWHDCSQSHTLLLVANEGWGAEALDFHALIASSTPNVLLASDSRQTRRRARRFPISVTPPLERSRCDERYEEPVQLPLRNVRKPSDPSRRPRRTDEPESPTCRPIPPITSTFHPIGEWPASNAYSGEPDEVPDSDINARLGNHLRSARTLDHALARPLSLMRQSSTRCRFIERAEARAIVCSLSLHTGNSR